MYFQVQRLIYADVVQTRVALSNSITHYSAMITSISRKKYLSYNCQNALLPLHPKPMQFELRYASGIEIHII